MKIKIPKYDSCEDCYFYDGEICELFKRATIMAGDGYNFDDSYKCPQCLAKEPIEVEYE